MTTNGPEIADVLVLGAGSAGEYVASELAQRGRRVVVVEDRLVGGECPYLACIPSKTLLLAGERGITWGEAIRRRDASAKSRDDSESAQSLERKGVTVIRGRGRVSGPDTVSVDGQTVRWSHLVVSTGGSASMPPIDGLRDVHPWTSDQALSSTERPSRLLILGGGAVGCELAQVYASFGTHVVVVETESTLLANEPAFVGETLADALTSRGVELRLGTKAESAERDGRDVHLQLEDGSVVTGDRLLVAAGKQPRTSDLGLDVLGVDIEDGKPLPVDDACRVPGHDNAWAAGDVTGIAPFTHTANYQARVVIAGIEGRPQRADYRAIPRAVYTDPAVFSVGITSDRSAGHDVDLVSTSFDVGHTARAFVEREAGAHATGGRLELYADRRRGVLVGAVAVGPYADTWMGELVLAVHAEVPVRVLAQVVHAFPTVGEAIEPPARELAEALEAP